MSNLPKITLPVWMNKGEPLTLAHASKTWWERVYGWLTFPLAQIDPDTCDERLLSLLAYQRDIERFPGESLSLFRLRVKFAFVNAKDAGSMAGFARIFERLEIGKIQQLERQLQYDWDVILMRINDEQLSRDNTLMMRLVRQYGRTCRRYFFDVVNALPAFIRSGEFAAETTFTHAKWIPAPVISGFLVNGQRLNEFAPQSSFQGASFQILVESDSAVTWSAEGVAEVDESGMVRITGSGSAKIICENEKKRKVIYRLEPLRFFTPAEDRFYADRFPLYAESIGQRLASRDELVVGGAGPESGALWNEWGNMEAYGWRKNNNGGTDQEYWSTDYSYISADVTGRTYVMARLRTGALTSVNIKQYTQVYSVVTVEDLAGGVKESEDAKHSD